MSTNTDMNLARRHQTWMIGAIVLFLGCLARDVIADEIRQVSATIADSSNTPPNRHEQLAQILIDKLAFYASEYPDIAFVVLDSSGDITRNMQVIGQLLGKDPIPLDYAHPPGLREQLLAVTLIRIEILLQLNAGSSTLFKVGSGAATSRENVCIVTIDPWAVARDDSSATRHLLTLPDADIDAIPTEHYLNYEAHLQFVMDHEIYHCLDSRYNGPVSMSHLEHWGNYNMLRNETGADAFAMIMHIAAHQAVTPYAYTMQQIRGVALLSGDLHHNSYAALTEVLQLAPNILAQYSVRQRFQIANMIRNRTVKDFDDYVHYATAAYAAMQTLGLSFKKPEINQSDVDTILVQALVAQTQSCYRNLIGRDYLP